MMKKQREVTAADAKKLALMNACQLMRIAIEATDEHIKDVYGGEDGMLDLIQGYMRIYEAMPLHDGTGSPLVAEVLKYVTEDRGHE